MYEHVLGFRCSGCNTIVAGARIISDTPLHGVVSETSGRLYCEECTANIARPTLTAVHHPLMIGTEDRPLPQSVVVRTGFPGARSYESDI